MNDPLAEIARRLHERGVVACSIRILDDGTMRVATKANDFRLNWDESRPSSTLEGAFHNAGLLRPTPEPETQMPGELMDLLA